MYTQHRLSLTWTTEAGWCTDNRLLGFKAQNSLDVEELSTVLTRTVEKEGALRAELPDLSPKN